MNKKYTLTDTERYQIQSRRMIAQQHDYIKSLVERDTQEYMRSVVLPRLNLDPNTRMLLSDDGSYIEVPVENDQKDKNKKETEVKKR